MLTSLRLNGETSIVRRCHRAKRVPKVAKLPLRARPHRRGWSGTRRIRQIARLVQTGRLRPRRASATARSAARTCVARETAGLEPLPDLRARDLGRGGVLHQVVQRGRARRRPATTRCSGYRPRRWLPSPASVICPPGTSKFVKSAASTETSPRCRYFWLGLSPKAWSKISIATGTRSGMGDPRAVEAIARLALLVLAHLGQGVGRDLRLASVGDEGAHAAHRVRAAAVARLDQQLRVGAHERHGHRHLRAVRQDRARRIGRVRLDDAEDVVPAAGVEARGVLAQLVQDLVHLERGPDRLDQHGRADRAARNAELRPGTRRTRRSTVAPRGATASWAGRSTAPMPRPSSSAPLWNRYSPKSNSDAGHGRAVDLDVTLDKVPATRPHDEGREVVAEAVFLALRRAKRERAPNGVLERRLAADDVRPRGRERVLEIGHEHLGAAVESVDRHLGLGRAGDLDAPIVQVRRCRRHLPLGCANVGCLRKEPQALAACEPRGAIAPRGQDLLPPRLKLAMPARPGSRAPAASARAPSPARRARDHGRRRRAHRPLILGMCTGSMRRPAACSSISTSSRRRRVSSRLALITHHVICRR